MDYYKQKKFICEITGHSALSYFDALQSEKAGSLEVDSAFPDPLKGPVLRRIQFSTISRLDHLVDHIFEEFKQDFYPGETVTVVLDDDTRLNGLVRDKARFPEIRRPDGTIIRKAMSRYFVKLLNRADEEALVDDDHIVRDRKIFTKQMLRSFIKNTVTREAWTGAPWLVKAQVADEFRIDTNVPLHLQHGSKQQEKKEKTARKSDQDPMFSVWQTSRLPELKPALKARKGQMSQDEIQALERQQFEEYQRALNADPSFPQPWDQNTPHSHDQWQGYALPYQNGYDHMVAPPSPPESTPKPAPPPPIKYPIDDLEIQPIRDGTHRPALKFIAIGDNVTEVSTSSIIPGLTEKSVGLLLETWTTLNVHCQTIQVDSFTFDDFLEALQFSSDEIGCELLVEIHCALLKQLVNAENYQNGALQISLPDLPQDDDDDENEDEEEESEERTPTPEPEAPQRMSTRSSLHKVENASDQQSRSRSNTADPRIHQAKEMFEEHDWIDRLRKRDFQEGGWQMILAGLLHQVSGRPSLKETCDRILVHLMPLDVEPSVETIQVQYSTMDINLRLEALQTICMLFFETKAVKTFLEEMSATMTTYRKQKIEHQRARKEAIAKLKSLHDERRLLAPEEKTPTPEPELADQAGLDDDDTISVADSEDDEPLTSRSLRRGNDRALERKRKREEEQERKDKAAEAKQNKGSKEYQKVLKLIEKERDRIDEAEEAIMIVDNDLREADCSRTRCLGKDRFCNRYYWFERNAMPHSGLPDSSTADAKYANGRVWVQGPDDMEREGFIDVSEAEMRSYYQRFQMTPVERKRLEEGATSVNTAFQWGYYDNPEEIDMLIGWLDIRGFRELKLKKELNAQRDYIIKHMENRKQYLNPREESDEEPATRMTTRTRTYISDKSHRCLRWTNTAALEHLGHKHADPPPKPRPRGKKVAAVVETRQKKGVAVAVNRSGKPLTRQGSRYAF